jgi:hypothetical protein
MCLDKGRKPTAKEFEDAVHRRNYDHLCIWQTVGDDVDNGEWAIYGARLGTYMTMLTDWDYRDVQDFDKLAALWEEYKGVDVAGQTWAMGVTLQQRLGLPVVDMNAEQSKFFKHHYSQAHRNLGASVSEMDVIRRIEGW